MDMENFHKLRVNTILEVMDLPNEKGLVRMGGVIYDIVKKKTHHSNKTYMFIKLLDTKGMFEITLFNETLDKYLDIIKEKTSIIIEGNFEKKQNIIKIVANKIIPFEAYKKNFIKTIKLHLKTFQFQILKDILDEIGDYNGIYKIVIIYRHKEYLLNNLININDGLLEKFRVSGIRYVM
jgi:DNA polymerase III alpha subunit